MDENNLNLDQIYELFEITAGRYGEIILHEDDFDHQDTLYCDRAL
jgi:hypothetical protein